MKSATACGVVILTLIFWVQNIEGNTGEDKDVRARGEQYNCLICRTIVDPKSRQWIKDPDPYAGYPGTVEDCMNRPTRALSKEMGVHTGKIYCNVRLDITNEHKIERFMRHVETTGNFEPGDPRWNNCWVDFRREEEDSSERIECTCHSVNCNTQSYNDMISWRRAVVKGASSRIQDSLALMTTLLFVLF